MLLQWCHPEEIRRSENFFIMQEENPGAKNISSIDIGGSKMNYSIDLEVLEENRILVTKPRPSIR